MKTCIRESLSSSLSDLHKYEPYSNILFRAAVSVRVISNCEVYNVNPSATAVWKVKVLDGYEDIGHKGLNKKTNNAQFTDDQPLRPSGYSSSKPFFIHSFNSYPVLRLSLVQRHGFSEDCYLYCQDKRWYPFLTARH